MLAEGVTALPANDAVPWNLIAVALWTLLGSSLVLGIWGVARRTAWKLLVAGFSRH